MQMKFRLAAFLFIICFQQVSATDGPLNVPSSLKTVTVYRSGAELIHNSSVQLSQSNQQLVIEGVSNHIGINSVQINCPAVQTLNSVITD